MGFANQTWAEAQFGHTAWEAGLGKDLGQGATCSCSLQTRSSHHLRPLTFCLPAHGCSPTIPHTPFGGETLYFRLVLGQSPVFVPGEREQGQEQTERCDCGLTGRAEGELGSGGWPCSWTGTRLSPRWLTADAVDGRDGIRITLRGHLVPSWLNHMWSTLLNCLLIIFNNLW